MNFQPVNNQRVADIAGANYAQEIALPGRFVYCRTHSIRKQFKQLSTFGPCVLLTSFSDAIVTTRMANRLPKNVEHWFSNNVETTHPKVTAIPIGMLQSVEKEQILSDQISLGVQPPVNTCTMCFLRNIPCNPNPREGIYELLGGGPWITAKGGFEHIPADIFYQDMRHHPFTISPPGAGPDCHRHWEAIALGSIPIVIRSRATDILADMPCLRIDHWAQVTERLLMNEHAKLHERFSHDSMKKLDMGYWRERILEWA